MDWSVTSTVVMTMGQIVGSIVKNQASGWKWLSSEAIVDTVNANPILRLATVDALAVFSPSLSYIYIL